VIVSSLALREHYRMYGDSPCSINERWDCGVVNHSRYAMLAGIPVATIGIAGYILMAALASLRSYACCSFPHSRGSPSPCTWRISKRMSSGLVHLLRHFAGDISLMSLLTLGTVVAEFVRKPSPA